MMQGDDHEGDINDGNQPKDILYFMRDKKSMSDVRAVSIIVML